MLSASSSKHPQSGIALIEQSKSTIGPRVYIFHVLSREVQTPLAQARPFPPQLLPIRKTNIRDEQTKEEVIKRAHTTRHRNIRRTRRPIPRTHLRHITARILRRPTHLRRRRKRTLLRATSTTIRITHRSRFELARCGVATGRVDTFTRVTFFAGFDDTVSAHS